jgi:hypothetical protein
MEPQEKDLENNQEHLSQTGPNELNEEDLGLSEDGDKSVVIGEGSISDDDNDTMEDPVNDLDEDEVKRIFPAGENPNKDNDMDDLNSTV